MFHQFTIAHFGNLKIKTNYMTELKGIRFYYLRRKGTKVKYVKKEERISFLEKTIEIKTKAERINKKLFNP